jgi:hypothetical protein
VLAVFDVLSLGSYFLLYIVHRHETLYTDAGVISMSIFVHGDAGTEYEVGRSRAPSVHQSRLVTTILGTLFSNSWKTAAAV